MPPDRKPFDAATIPDRIRRGQSGGQALRLRKWRGAPAWSAHPAGRVARARTPRCAGMKLILGNRCKREKLGRLADRPTTPRALHPGTDPSDSRCRLGVRIARQRSPKEELRRPEGGMVPQNTLRTPAWGLGVPCPTRKTTPLLPVLVVEALFWAQAHPRHLRTLICEPCAIGCTLHRGESGRLGFGQLGSRPPAVQGKRQIPGRPGDEAAGLPGTEGGIWCRRIWAVPLVAGCGPDWPGQCALGRVARSGLSRCWPGVCGGVTRLLQRLLFRAGSLWSGVVASGHITPSSRGPAPVVMGWSISTAAERGWSARILSPTAVVPARPRRASVYCCLDRQSNRGRAGSPEAAMARMWSATCMARATHWSLLWYS
jgi:hypothetical protein